MTVAELERSVGAGELLVETPWGVARVVRPWTRHVRLAGGISCAAASLALPWLGDPLFKAATAWSLPIRLGWFPSSTYITYGLVNAVAAVAMVASIVRHGGQSSPMSRCAAGVLVASALLFVFSTRVIGGPTAFELRAHQVQHDAITRQFGYGTNSQSLPTSVLGIGADHTTLGLFGLLRPGWYLAVTSGLILLGSRRSPGGVRARWRMIARVGAVASGLVIVLVVGLGLRAQQEKLRGIQALQTGHHDAAAQHLSVAVRLNPWLRLDPDVALALGRIDLAHGRDRTGLALYARAAGPEATVLTPVQRALLLDEAMRSDPGNEVIAEADAEVMGRAVQAAHLASGGRSSTSVLVAYSIGRAAFAQGDYNATVANMRQALVRSDNDDIRSSAYTYIALARHAQLDDVGFRRYLRLAVQADSRDRNQLARELAAGLYVPGQ